MAAGSVENVLSEWRFYRSLTSDFLATLSHAELEFAPGPGLGPFWKQFRHVGRVQEDYLDAIRNGEITFSPLGKSYSGGADRDPLISYLGEVDRAQDSLLAGLDESVAIRWGGEAVPLATHLLRLVAHETLHHGMWLVYARLLGKSLPPSWAAWGEETA